MGSQPQRGDRTPSPTTAIIRSPLQSSTTPRNENRVSRKTAKPPRRAVSSERESCWFQPETHFEPRRRARRGWTTLPYSLPPRTRRLGVNWMSPTAAESKRQKEPQARSQLLKHPRHPQGRSRSSRTCSKMPRLRHRSHPGLREPCNTLHGSRSTRAQPNPSGPNPKKRPPSTGSRICARCAYQTAQRQHPKPYPSQDPDDFSAEDSSPTKLKQRRLRAVQLLPMTVSNSCLPPSPATHQTSRF